MKRFLLLFSLLALTNFYAFAADEVVKVEPKRYAFYPSFVTNLAHPLGKSFMQFRVNAYTVDAHSEKVLAANEPLLRDKILIIINQQNPTDMRSKQGIAKLTDKVKVTINELLKAQSPKANVVKVMLDRVIVE